MSPRDAVRRAVLPLALLATLLPAAAHGQQQVELPQEQPAPAQVAEPVVPTLSAEQAGDFLGEWVLTVKAQEGQEFDLDLRLAEQEGIAVAEIELPRMGSTTVKHMLKTEEGIRLHYEVAFGEQRFNVQMDLKRTEEGLIGKMADQSGLFSLGFTGVDRQALLALDQTAGDDDQTRRRRRRGGDSETATLTLAGQEIRLRYDQVSVEDEAYGQVESPVDGAVVSYVKNRPAKLFTPTDLRFGDAVVKAHNQTRDYPGVYSVWLKSAAGEWRLVFNNLADAWGTQHDPTQDVVEVPLQAAKAAQPAPVLTVKLEPSENGGGLLKIAWGDREWTAPFQIVSAGGE